MTNNKLLALCALLAVLTIGSQKSNEEALGQETFVTMNTALDAIGSKYQVRVGLEYAPNDPDQAPISLNFAEENAAATLDRLIDQRPDYIWELSDGVYDLHPKLSTDSLLDVHVRTFSVNDVSPEAASHLISALPEVRAWLQKRGVRRRELELGSGPKISGVRLSLTLRDTTVRGILNHLIVKAGKMRWVVVRYGQNSQYIAMHF
jgi:hypothetical protein